MLYDSIKTKIWNVRDFTTTFRLIAIICSLFITPNAFSAEDTRLLMSLNADRSAATLLSGQTVSGNAHIFLQSTQRIRKVKFFLDKDNLNSKPLRTDWRKPFDFRPSGNRKARPFDINQLSNGKHFVVAKVYFRNGKQQVIKAEFTVDPKSVPRVAPQISGIGKLETSIRSLNFDEGTIGESSTSKKVVLKNIGSAPININQIWINGDFSWVANNCKKLSVGETCSVDIKFVPSQKGRRFGLLVIVNDTKKRVESVALTGIGDSGSQNLSLSWQPTSELITGYKVYSGPSSDSVDHLLKEVAISEIDTNAPSVKLSVAKNTPVCFRLRAYNEFGISDFSEPICTL